MDTSPPLQIEELLDHTEWIARLARRLVGDAHADDLVQETWLAALRHRPGRERSLRPWLARVARNFARQRARGARRAERLGEQGEVATSLPSADELAERAETQAALVQAVRELDEPHRSTVLLRYYEGLSSEEIARRLGVPAATVRSRLKRAVAELRGRLDALAGGQRRWVVTLAPLFVESPWAGGVIAMKSSTKAGLAVGLVALLAAGGYGLRGLVLDSGEAHGGARTGMTLEAPVTADAVAERAAVSPGDAASEPREQIAPESITSEPGGAKTAVWRGRLVDERTGEPVPAFRFSVRQGALEESVESDGEGTFATSSALAAGELELKLEDRDGVPRNTTLQIGEGSLERSSVTTCTFDPERADVVSDVPIEVGPTYVLELARPRELALDGLVATVLPPDDSWHGFLRVVGSTPVRAGEAPWARFGRLARGMLKEGPPWTLEVRSADGMWLGRSSVDSIVGVYPTRVLVELEARGRVVGRVTDLAGDPVSDASVALHSDAHSGLATSNETGAFSIDWVPPATYELAVHSARHEPASVTITVRPNEDTTHDVGLVPLPESGAVSGTLTSRTGEYEQPVLVVLYAKADPGRQLHATPTWSETGGEMRGTFVFEEVPSGEYVLSVHSFMDNFAWAPSEHAVTPPASGVDLLCLDDAPTTHLCFRVLDAQSHQPIDSFHATYSANGTLEMGIGMSAGTAFLMDVPTNGSLDWAIAADGYATTFGTLADFVPVGSTSTAEVLLGRGWRTRILAVTPDGAPASSVTIEIDGEPAGTTDQHGRATLRSTSRPGSVVLRTRNGGSTEASSLNDHKLLNRVTVGR